MQTPPLTKMKYEDIMKIYMKISRSYPLSCTTIHTMYHPDNLPKPLQDQMAKYPSIRRFCNDVYKALTTKGFIQYAQFENIVGSFMKVDSPDKIPSPAATSKMSFEDIFKIYTLMAPSFPVSFRDILTIYNPSTLPIALRQQIEYYPEIKKFANGVYRSFIQEGTIATRERFELIMKKHIPKRVTTSSVRQSPKTVLKMTKQEIMNIYMSFGVIYPLKRVTILLKFHPDKLPAYLKKQMKLFPDINKYCSRIFDAVLKRGIIENTDELRTILEKEKL